jgi:hypothetical protein
MTVLRTTGEDCPETGLNMSIFITIDGETFILNKFRKVEPPQDGQENGDERKDERSVEEEEREMTGDLEHRKGFGKQALRDHVGLVIDRCHAGEDEERSDHGMRTE